MNHIKCNSIYKENHIRQISLKRASQVPWYNRQNVSLLLELLNTGLLGLFTPRINPLPTLRALVPLERSEQNVTGSLIRTVTAAWTALPISGWFTFIVLKSQSKTLSQRKDTEPDVMHDSQLQGAPPVSRLKQTVVWQGLGHTFSSGAYLLAAADQINAHPEQTQTVFWFKHRVGNPEAQPHLLLCPNSKPATKQPP